MSLELQVACDHGDCPQVLSRELKHGELPNYLAEHAFSDARKCGWYITNYAQVCARHAHLWQAS